jgi:two-component system CheB/CheR fusion protein
MASILVVDDERLICELLQVVLSSQGHEVIVASNGEQALDLFAKRRPRLTLLDICMPGLDGIEVLRQIHWMDPLAAVMILTAMETDTLRLQAKEWGVSEYLTKGLPLDKLISAVERAIVQSEKRSTLMPSVSVGRQVGPDEPATILVVDDDEVVRGLLTDFLSRRGYRVLAAHDGPAALSLVDEQPRLVVLDIYMPGMNGVKVLREIRAKRYAGGVIVLSGCEEEKLLEELLNMGAVEFMAKPFDLERLALAVQVGLILTKP